MKSVLITGATGAIGPVVVETFLQAGYQVRTYSRKDSISGVLPAVVDHYSGEITDSSRIQMAMDGVDLVIHMAALLHITNPKPEMRSQYWRINVEGTKVVVTAAQMAGVKRFVFGSTIAVYGYHRGHLLTEVDVPQPDSLYSETKLAAERVVRTATRPDGEPFGVVLRLASTYGVRVKGNYQRLVRSLARGTFLPIGTGDNRRTLVHEHDVARALLLAANHPQAINGVFNVTDGYTYTMRDIMGAICHALGRKPPTLSMPVRPVRVLAGLLEDGARVIGKQSPIGRGTIDKYVEDVQVSGRRIQEILGFRPRYTLAEGWAETIQMMRKAGEL